jgi:hypothetical protein
MRLERPGWRVITDFQQDRPWDVSRNLVATLALNSGAEWCFFWDSDIVVPPYALTRLVGHGLPIIGGIYYRRHPEIWPEVFRYPAGGVMLLEPVSKRQLEEEWRATAYPVLRADGIGAGCFLVNTMVLKKMKDKVPYRSFTVKGPPTAAIDYYEFFKYGMGDPEMHKQGEGYSEDLVFCVRAKKLGFQIYVDMTVACTHLTRMGIREGTIDFAPLEVGRG